MKLFNNTPVEVQLTITCASSADCGTIDAGDTSDWPYYDNQENVTVSFSVNSSSPTPEPFRITIPETGTGMAVTIGIYQE